MLSNYFSFKNKNRRIYPALCLLLLFSVCSFAQEAQPVNTTTISLEKTKKVECSTAKIPAHRKTTKMTKIQPFLKANKTTSDYKKDLDLCKTKLQKIEELGEVTVSMAKYVHAKKELTKKVEDLDALIKKQNATIEE